MGSFPRCLQSFHVLQFAQPRVPSFVAMSRLPGQIKTNDYLVVYFSAGVIGRRCFCVLGVCLALVLCPTLLFCCSLRVDLLLIDKGQEVNALPVLVDQGRRTFFSFFFPPPNFTHMGKELTAGFVFWFLLLSLGTALP